MQAVFVEEALPEGRYLGNWSVVSDIMAGMQESLLSVSTTSYVCSGN
jgi:hypothetical protein